MENALVTLSIDLPEQARCSHAVFQAYAERHHLAFEVIDSARYFLRPNWFIKRRVRYHVEKFQLFDLLGKYRRILYLDTDMLINAGCPDILQLVPTGQLGCVYDDLGTDSWKRVEELRRLSRKLGPLPEAQWRYFNTGLMVLDQSHRELFRMDRSSIKRGRWPEQTLLNYRVIRDQIPLHLLDSGFNFMPDGNNSRKWQQERASAHIVHYAGPEAKLIMEQDVERVFNEWGLASPSRQHE